MTTYAAFKRLLDAGVSPNWFSNWNGQGNVYVCSSMPNGDICSPCMIARLLTVPTRRSLVARYRDKNPFNFRPDNIVLEERRTRAKLRELGYSVNSLDEALIGLSAT